MQLVEYGGLDKTPVQPQTNDQEASQEQQSEDVKKAVIPWSCGTEALQLCQARNRPSGMGVMTPREGRKTRSEICGATYAGTRTSPRIATRCERSSKA